MSSILDATHNPTSMIPPFRCSHRRSASTSSLPQPSGEPWTVHRCRRADARAGGAMAPTPSFSASPQPARRGKARAMDAEATVNEFIRRVVEGEYASAGELVSDDLEYDNVPI